jgi:hypothetical protein
MTRSRVARTCGFALLCAQLSVGASGQGQTPPQGPPSVPPQGAPPQGPPAGRGAPGVPGMAPPQPPSPAAIERAAQILAETRKAMGGDKLTAVRTLIANGRTRRVRGDNLVPIEFEIAIELPDKYVRKDEVPAEESEPTSTGFAGTTLIQYPAGRGAGPGGPGGPGGAAPGAARAGGPPPAGAPSAGSGQAPGAAGAAPGAPGSRAGGPPPAPTPEQLAAMQAAQQTARLNQAKQDFARLALGVWASSLETFPLTFAFAARAEAPQGTADVLDVTGPGNFKARLFIQGDTHLPVMVSWQAPPTGVVITTPDQPKPKTVAPGAVIVSAAAAPPASAPQEEKDKYNKEMMALRAKTMATPIEYRLYYADYRDVDGVKLPFRLRRAIGADTTEETTFDRFRLNSKIDPRKFTVPQR